MTDNSDRIEGGQFIPSDVVQDELPCVLVVEDDDDLLTFIVMGLCDQYEVVTAVNGEDGLSKAREYIPDLIITDLMMPVMDGMVMSRKLKTSPETSHIPIIMLTAKKALESQLEGFEIGADDYITKPFHEVLLEARIKNLLKTRQMLREQFTKEFLAGDRQPFIENTVDREFMEMVLGVIETNYSDWNFKSDELAAALNMSVRTLQRKLKAVADQTPASFLNEYRMMQAAKLLINTNLTITEITFKVGCDESSHFTRMFKKHYNMSPSKYRFTHFSSP